VGKRVLITRMGWFGSHRLAKRLEADPEIDYILGIDVTEPAGELDRTEFLRADVRESVLMRILEATGIDTVVHLGLYSTPNDAGGGRGTMHDFNVIGAMQLFAACQRVSEVKRVIIRSSTAVYGAASNDPAVFTEEMYRSDPPDPFGRDCGELEGYARALARRRPDIDMTLFRFANIIGPGADTPLARYLTMPLVPTVLGFDPRLQFIHEADATDLLAQAIAEPVVGTYNAAADGVLFLSQVLRIGGRIEVPVPMTLLNLAEPLSRVVRGGIEVPPHIVRLINWGRIADNRRLKEEFGFVPRYTTRETVEEFYAEHRLRRMARRPRERSPWERELSEFVTRKGQERFLERVRGPRDDPGG